MGEDGYCADQTRYVCGNPVDDPLLDIRGVADSLVPQEKSTVVVQRNDPIDWREIALAGCGKTRFEADAVPRNSLVSTAQPDKKKACVEKTSSSWMCLAT